MRVRTSLLLISAIICLSTACQKAVKEPQEAVYTIKGNRASPLYPSEVRQNSEDVVITLKPDAPRPDIATFDQMGNQITFNFTRNDNTIIVPGKFDHLRLSHGGDASIDIFRQTSD